MTTNRLSSLLISAALLCLGSIAQAQILLSDFGALSSQLVSFNGTWATPVNQFVQNTGNISILPVSGGSPAGDGSFDANMPGNTSYNLSLTPLISLVASTNSGNTSATVSVILLDAALNTAGTATFTTASFGSTFTTRTAPIITSVGNISAVRYFTIAGDGNNQNPFRMSFDNAAAVPEPSSILLLGLGATALVSARRRRS